MNFCTLFNRHYLTRGLALWASLKRHCPDFHLWILCMDSETEQMLAKMQLSNVSLVPLHEVEDEKLLTAKGNRSAVEYCWTCTPVLPLHLLKKYPDLPHIIYLDADIYFFNDPHLLLQEIDEGSTLIFEHKFPPRTEKQAMDVGKYNVEVIVFKNDANSKACLEWWRDRCIEWCYDRVEPGRMGDQKYLDEWPRLFSGVVVASDRIPGIAPWNLETYRFGQNGQTLLANGSPVLFFHFSKLSILGQSRFRYCKGYLIPWLPRRLAYRPYTAELERQLLHVRRFHPEFSAGIVKLPLRERMGDLFFKFRTQLGFST